MSDKSYLAIRFSKVVLIFGLALWTLLVAVGNVTDYETNWVFVQHVMSMDTTSPESTLRARAIEDETLQRFGYIAIIVCEGLTSLAFFLSSALMAARIRAPNARFVKAKHTSAIGVTLGSAVWFIGFMVVGGEWFAMWQSSQWNAQDSAFRFALSILVVALYVFADNDG